MTRENHSSSSSSSFEISNEEEEEQQGVEMVRFSLGREEDDNEGGPSRPTRRSVPKRWRISARTFSCTTVHHRQEQEQERGKGKGTGKGRQKKGLLRKKRRIGTRNRSRNLRGISDGGDEQRMKIHGSAVSRENRFVSVEDHPDRDLEGSKGHGSISVMLSDPDVFDCPICVEHLSVPVF